MATSSSVSDSQLCPRCKYDVFLNFRGEDTRNIFIGHLYEGLKNRRIYTFQDDTMLERGYSNPKGLMKAIEESQVALLIFSKNYAASTWCLSELVKIMECKEKNRLTVIPIYYHLDPSNVRHQSNSFAEAFAKHELRFKDDVEGMQKVQGWRTALVAAANLKGYDIGYRIESDCIKEIVDQVSSKLCPRWKYDVFLSFRGADTRKTFMSHLYKALTNMSIHTFQDDESLKQGDSIPKELIKAIEESQVALLIFSKNYAASTWCLSELVKIMECKEKNRQTVIPIFYDVDPSHVRYQLQSFAVAFAEHELRFKDDVEGMQKVQGWRAVLTAAANLKGCNIRDRIESDCIDDIVDQVSSKLLADFDLRRL